VISVRRARLVREQYSLSESDVLRVLVGHDECPLSDGCVA
ncbi:hypothetical protein A2U01_0114551, partial [Trifolium medium]|nr:hypothetical protein [Trifolium medium]